MKNYNKILEAVNQGIKFALDDFEDQEDIQGQVNSKVNHYKGSWKEILDSFVDLGLPTGTLWCKYNLGAKNEYDYGDYYAWGELEPKRTYTDENYTYKGLYKQLPPEYDVATLTLGENYSIPTKELLDELRKYTNNKWVENYNGTGINGRLFISKINSNSLFIPAAGEHNFYRLYNNGDEGNIWSSSLNIDKPIYAWYLQIRGNNVDMYDNNRSTGFSIRPVINLNDII